MKGLRIAGATLMVASAFGPLAVTPVPTAEAKNLQWGFMRPILTTEADSTDTNGYDFLPAYGNVLHAVAVAPNGDVFTAGQDGTTTTLFKSTDQGQKWRSSTLTGFPASALIRQIVISPDYPSDDFIAVVFSDDDGTASEAADGLGISTDEGLTFSVAFSGASALATATMATTEWSTVALSSDFNWNDGAGLIALGGENVVGGAGTGSIWRANVSAFKAGTATAAGFAAMTTGGVAEAPGVNTLHLTYAKDEEPIALARLVTGGGVTVGQISTGSDWSVADGSNTIVAAAANAGEVAFDDDYELNGVFFAAVSTGVACPAATCGGTFKFNGSWTNETLDEGPCASDAASLFLSGNGSSTKVVTAQNSTITNQNVVCRSGNNGSTFADDETDGGSDAIERIAPPATASHVRVAGGKNTSDRVYWTSAGNFGGLSVSTNNGSSWKDGSLTNQTYRVNHVQEIDANVALARGVDAAGNTSIWRTENYGNGAAWYRVERTSNINSTIESPTADIKYVSRSGEGDKRLLKSSDGGINWAETGADPVDDELIQATGTSGASIVLVGTDEGRVYLSTDGGGSWTAIAKDFGSAIDEFDFTAEPTTWFVTSFESEFKVWLTKDGGATFTQVGNSPWGTGQGSIDFQRNAWNPADDTGYLIVRTSGATSTDDVFRMMCPCTTGGVWEELDIDSKTFTSSFFYSTPGVGEGRVLLLSGGGADGLQYSVTAGTMKKADIDESQTAASTSNERDNPLYLLPDPPAGSAGCGTSGTISTHRSLTGVNIQFSGSGAGGVGAPGCGQIRELTLPTSFTTGPVASSPINGTSVPTNVGDQSGVPTIFRWNNVPDAEAYDLLVGLTPDLTDGTLFADIGTNLLVMTGTLYPLVKGNQYYYALRVSKIKNESGSANVEGESPWSAIAAFTVSTTSVDITAPSPSLPSNGANLPGVATQLSWNNPAGVTQVHLQVTPLNGDGPAINLIMNATNNYDIPAPVFGTGPYVMLPGATYTWRVRVSGSTTAIGEADNSWGPWSQPQTFTTAKPNAGSLQLVAPINGAAVTDTTPTVEWKSANPSDFYYEIQLSSDPNFGEQGIKAAVFHNLIHGGVSTPPNSWTVPDANALPKGQYYWRVRQRVQATPAGAAETGIAWSPAQGFVVN